MPKVKLSRIVTHQGRTYGPGEIEIDDEELAAALNEREKRHQTQLKAAEELRRPAAAKARGGAQPKNGGEG